MTLFDLFEMCDNLTTGSIIIVRGEDLLLIDDGEYPEMHALYGDKPITYFKIDDARHATIYLKGVRK